MLSYALRRFMGVVPTLIGISLVTFVVINLAPGDPTELSSGGTMRRVSRQALEQMRHLYGLDRPILVRYGIWLRRLAQLDFGNSFADHRPVLDKILERLPATLQLNVLSLVLALLVSVPLGVVAAVRQNGVFDKLTGAVTYMLYSLPNYWVALLLVMFVGVNLDLLPFYGIESDFADRMPWGARLWDRVLHLVLPVICLTYGSLAFLSRFARATLLEVIRQDYIRTARAKGLSEYRVLSRHAVKNAMVPLITLLALLIPSLVSGSVILEYIFAWPGIGQLYFHSILTRDYPTIMGLSAVSAVLVLLATLAADILYAVVDPRVTYS